MRPTEKASEKSSTSSPAPGNKATKDKSSFGKPLATPNLSLKLGEDGKLTKEERQHHFDNNLCMFCGKSGHMARDCHKASSHVAKARSARPMSPEAELDDPKN